MAKILLLLSEQDIGEFPPNLLVENIKLRTDKTVLNEVLVEDYTNVMITSNFVNIYGIDSITKIIKTLHILTSSKIHYLRLDGLDDIDAITSYMYSLGIGNIHPTSLRSLTLDTFQRILKTNIIREKIEVPDTTLTETELLYLQTTLQNLLEEESAEYLRKMKGTIIDSIKNLIIKIRENEELKKTVIELSDINEFLSLNKEELEVKTKMLERKYDKKEEDFMSLRTDVISYMDAINTYNKVVVDNHKSKFSEADLLTNSNITIIYFKEYEDIGFFNYFEAIVHMLQKGLKTYTKALIIEQEGREYFDQYTGKGYITISDEPSLESLINEDKLIRYGNPNNIFKTITRPEFRTEILIVFDRSKHEKLMVKSDILLPFYIGSYKNKIKTLLIDENSWISPVEGKWKNINSLMDRRILNGEEEIIFNSHVSNHSFVDYLRKLLTKSKY